MSNFTFLQTRWPELYRQAAQAESALHLDADVTAFRLRVFAEHLVSALFQSQGLPMPEKGRQLDHLRYLEDNGLVDRRILGKLHALRLLGNKAAHGATVSRKQAAGLLEDAWSLAQWFCRLTAPQDEWANLPFRHPDPPSQPGSKAAETVVEALAESGGEKEDASQAGPAEKAKRLPRDDAERILEASGSAFDKLHPEMRELRTTISLKDAFAGETLSSGQEELIGEFERFFEDRDARVFLLKGHAGTGKTFILRGLTTYLSAQGRSFRLCAPTGRAAKVIEEKTGHAARTLHATIYNFEKLVEYTDDGLEGSETFKHYAQIAVNDDAANTVYIADEASLLSDVYQEGEFYRSGSGCLLRDFLNFVGLDHNDHDKKIILVGDPAQLPPVDMPFSPALDADYLRTTYGTSHRGYELKEVVRQKAGSGILKNVMPLRDSLEGKVFSKLTFDFSADDIEAVPANQILSSYLDSCDHAINGKSIIVTRSNAEAAESNRIVRQHFFPDKTEVTAGDKLMVVANIQLDGLFISNGDFAWVKEVSEQVEVRRVPLKRKHPDTKIVEMIDVSLSFRDALLGVRNTTGRAQFFRTKILENLLYDNNPSLGSDEQKALYVDFCMRHEHLKKDRALFQKTLRSDPYFNALRVKFGYAVTCHKAQGSEWEHVFVTCPRDQSPLSAGYFRWLYTAMTRARSRLYLINPPHLPVGGEMEPVVPPHLTLRRSPEPTVPAALPDVQTESADAPLESFGLTEQDGILFGILRQVQAALKGSGIEIEGIVHNQYQEAYFFHRDGASTRLNIAYNGRGKVGRIMPVQACALSDELCQRLGAMVDKILLPVSQARSLSGTGVTCGADYRPNQDFLGEFHARLLPLAQERGIRIADVAEKQYCQRYTFARDSAAVVVDIWYNKKSAFSKFSPVSQSGPQGSLLPEVIDLLKVGMSA
ncbi:AAA family ATPase [Microvirga sp. Mcv34]|uniref:AAA family ATPase n=1 Tax=Microvirga sp. Mcv34 TaxID=2926016 RepID=UPI0021C87227|nr:AAA family ATPase [Microvirga sp. Mcv34]